MASSAVYAGVSVDIEDVAEKLAPWDKATLHVNDVSGKDTVELTVDDSAA